MMEFMYRWRPNSHKPWSVNHQTVDQAGGLMVWLWYKRTTLQNSYAWAMYDLGHALLLAYLLPPSSLMMDSWKRLKTPDKSNQENPQSLHPRKITIAGIMNSTTLAYRSTIKDRCLNKHVSSWMRRCKSFKLAEKFSFYAACGNREFKDVHAYWLVGVGLYHMWYFIL